MELIFLDHLQSIRTTVLDHFFVFMTHLGDFGLIWVGLAVLLFIFKKTRHIGIMITIALFLSLLITNGLLKNLLQRPRPFNHRELVLLIKTPLDYSFPSGHTSISFAAAFILIQERFKVKGVPIYVLLTILACLISFSRLYLYVHYPSDVLVAIIIGLICAKLSKNIYNQWIKP